MELSGPDDKAGYYESPSSSFAQQFKQTVKQITGKPVNMKILNGGTDGRKSLSCYHNNILHGSVQVRSLAELIAFTKRETAQGAAASVGNKERSSRAATILGLMKAGKDVTYRSLCLSRQIEETLADF